MQCALKRLFLYKKTTEAPFDDNASVVFSLYLKVFTPSKLP